MPQYKMICSPPHGIAHNVKKNLSKGCKYVNKKPKLIPSIYYAVKPLQETGFS